MAKKVNKMQVIPLGGVSEIGKNMTVLRYGQEIIIIDAGLKFPDDNMPGIDYIIPNFNYLIDHKNLIKGLCLTHGHEDHIGAVVFLLKELQIPIYGSPLTLGLLSNKLKEHRLEAKTQVVENGETIRLGRHFKIEYIQNNHSIPDSFAMAVTTPAGVLIHTGDFKIDNTPVSGPTINLPRLAEYGSQGVLALMIDSTNAEKEGYTKSEKIVGKTLEEVLAKYPEDRIFVATFASNIHRIQQVFTAAEKYGRKVASVGRSMIGNIEIATRLGYLKYNSRNYIAIEDIGNYSDHELLIISTGSQGEPLAGLTRMAAQNHHRVNIKSGDVVILSSTPIPGNERLISKVIDGLYRLGAKVLHQGMYDVHVSGHASREEIKMIIGLVQPQFIIPFHGEYRHQAAMMRLAKEMGFKKEQNYLAEIGDVIEVSENGIRKVGAVASDPVYVDSSSRQPVGTSVIKDRLQISLDGMLTVVIALDKRSKTILAGPELITRGFIYVRESEDLMKDLHQLTLGLINEQILSGRPQVNRIAQVLKDSLSAYIFERTERIPIILPLIVEI